MTKGVFKKIIKKQIGMENHTDIVDPALKERHYGVYTGKNKWQIKSEFQRTFIELIACKILRGRCIKRS
jgi:bisphosphoglycerate-dependent phosphoglycerate mutase